MAPVGPITPVWPISPLSPFGPVAPISPFGPWRLIKSFVESTTPQIKLLSFGEYFGSVA
nr:MAG TPA: hypothetical protein [Caudoviricetes sp.]